VLAASAPGCVPDLTDQASLVTGERVLAIAADPPEVGEGESVRLTALVASASDDDGAEVSYFLCLARKPLSELGPVAPTCLAGSSEERVLLGRGGGAELSIERGACSQFGPRRPGAEPGQPAGRAADPDATGGFYQPITAELAGQTAVLGGVRLDCGLPAADRAQVIEYNQRHRQNQNPRLERLELDTDGAWAELAETRVQRVRAGERVTLRASWAACAGDERCTGAEPYVMFDPAEQALVERTEVIIASWYATAGELDQHRTESPDGGATSASNGWWAPPDTGPVRLWVVLRDGRGGIGYGAYRFVVE
jgi:hypothetical protein